MRSLPRPGHAATMTRIARHLALCVFLLGGACYSYVPVHDRAVAPRERIRLELSDEGTRQLAQFLGPGVRQAEGIVTGVDGDTITLAVNFVQLSSGVRMPWTGEGVVRFPPFARRAESRHTFQRGKTVAAALAASAALVTTAVVALRTGGAGGDGETPPPPPPP